MATNFATRYKKDLSTSALKTKLVRRKSVLQKESRHNEFNKGRKFGLIDVNTQLPRDKELSCLEEMVEVPSQKSKAKPSQSGNAAVKTRGQERMEMLQRYKMEKELRKLKEQREKPVFKVGRYKPEAAAFLPPVSQIPVLSKPKEKVVAAAAVAPPVRVTRSRAKNQVEETVKSSARRQLPTIAPTYTSKGCSLRPAQHQKIYIDRPPKKESKAGGQLTDAGSEGPRSQVSVAGAQTSIPRSTNGRTTRATATALTKIPRASQLITNNLSQKRGTQKGKQQQRGLKNGGETLLHAMEENIVVEAVKEGGKSQIPPVVDTEQDEAFLEKENVPAPDIPAPALPRRNRSFAPQGFLFKPLDGLATYKVKPMTPSRANVFLSPNLCWSPTKLTSEGPEQGAKENLSQDCPLKCPSSPNPVVTEDHHLQERPSALESVEVKPECLASSSEVVDAVPCENALQQVDLPVTGTPDLAGEPQHDVTYFRKILQSETERLTSHCLEWDGTAEMDIPEEAKDIVRTTIGQTRLLMAERFKQFQGLVDNCEFKRGKKETTCADLDGFWDMVNFQVEDVNKKFENLRQLQKNGWQMVDDIQAKRPAKKKATSQRATRQRGGSAERTAARKRLEAFKAVMKNKMNQERMAEATDPEMPQDMEKVVFDGGFFKVESPAKPSPGWLPKSAARTQRVSRQSTPRSANRASLRRCVDTCVARWSPPVMSNSHLNPPGADLGCISEQSDTQSALGSCVKMGDLKGDANEMQTPTSDEHSPSREMNGLVSVHSQDTANSDMQIEVPDIADEMKQTVADLHEQDVLCNAGTDAPSEKTCAQAEEIHTPGYEAGPLLEDFSFDVALDLKPNPDCSLFTPLRSEARMFTAAATCDDLIVFSPLDRKK